MHSFKSLQSLENRHVKNMNELVKICSELEGGKKEMDIAQLKEAYRVLAVLLSKNEQALDIFSDYVDNLRTAMEIETYHGG